MEDIHKELDNHEEVLNSDSKTISYSRKKPTLSVYANTPDRTSMNDGNSQIMVTTPAIKALWKNGNNINNIIKSLSNLI